MLFYPLFVTSNFIIKQAGPVLKKFSNKFNRSFYCNLEVFSSPCNAFSKVSQLRRRKPIKNPPYTPPRNQSQQIIVLYLLGNRIIALANRIFPVEGESIMRNVAEGII